MNLSIFILFLFASFSSVHAHVSTYFNEINKDPNALYAFLKAMPKGGELHYHLSGGAYPESMLEYASKEDYCLTKDTFTITKNTPHCDGTLTKKIMDLPTLYAATTKAWSLKDFVPTTESAHAHFFNAFNKFQPIVADYSAELLTHIIQTAADQHLQYLEIMMQPDNANSLHFSSLIKSMHSFKKKKDTLLANKAFMNNIAFSVSDSRRILDQTHRELRCTTNPESPACTIAVKFQFYVLREQPLDRVFVQALTAFEAVSQSNGTLVAVNLVQPENGIISLRDYRKQMEIFNYFHTIYPEVNISLHAGELNLELAPPEDVSYHIHDAVFTGHASRIGHGAAISYENNAASTLDFMAQRQVAVEINLISNKKILHVMGKNHPLNFYLRHNVPVVLSTDDEGILRTNLTQQYVEAVLVHGLDYQTLKQINRNALTYAFLPGKSIWANPSKSKFVAECQDLGSETCHNFIKKNQKARFQWNLEEKLIAFEGLY